MPTEENFLKNKYELIVKDEQGNKVERIEHIFDLTNKKVNTIFYDGKDDKSREIEYILDQEGNVINKKILFP